MKKKEYKQLLEMSLKRIEELELISDKINQIPIKNAAIELANKKHSLGFSNILAENSNNRISVSNLFPDYESAISHKYSQNRRVHTFEVFMPELDYNAYIDDCLRREGENL